MLRNLSTIVPKAAANFVLKLRSGRASPSFPGPFPNWEGTGVGCALGKGAIQALIRKGDALLVVPPFASLDKPCLGVHILQGCAAGEGVTVSVFYGNMFFASLVGEDDYQSVATAVTLAEECGEFLFANEAFGDPSSSWGDFNKYLENVHREKGFSLSLQQLSIFQQVAAHTGAWVDAVAESAVRMRFKVVGCTTAFAQTSASIALLRRIKQMRDETLTIIGGPNCEGELAEGIASLSQDVDYVFSGESEATFTTFMTELLAGRTPNQRVLRGQPLEDLDSGPLPSYTEFFEQLKECLPNSHKETGETWIPYETSRGCTWRRCTFCGQNGTRQRYRQKSADRVLADLRGLVANHPTRRIFMVDNAMPTSFFRNLLPRIQDEIPSLSLFYELRPIITLAKALLLRNSGVNMVQLGVEALATSLLRRMRKGTTACENIAALRYLRVAGVRVAWLLLYGLPGDTEKDFESTLTLVPLLRHLEPPIALWPVRISRFSPYFEDPNRFGLKDLKPLEIYELAFSSSDHVEELANHFHAEYPSYSKGNPALLEEIREKVLSWRKSWFNTNNGPPTLLVRRLTDDVFLLRDTRGLPDIPQIQFLSHKEVASVLRIRAKPDEETQWAVQRKLGVILDGLYVPLVIAEPSLLKEFETVELENKGSEWEYGVQNQT